MLWTVVLKKTLESPLESKEIKPSQPSRKSDLNIHWKDWCWSWGSNNLATWIKKPTHWKRPWGWERLKAGGKGGQQRIKWLDGITDSMDMSLSKLWEILKDVKSWHAAVHRVAKNLTRHSNWTTTLIDILMLNTPVFLKWSTLGYDILFFCYVVVYGIWFANILFRIIACMLIIKISL